MVVKPAGFVPEAEWRAGVLSALPESPAFRAARPVRTQDGQWTAHGWEASELLSGQTDVSRQDEVLTAGVAFHEAVADLPRPDFLDSRDDPWAYGDRVAWEEQVADGSPAYHDVVHKLIEARRPVELQAQVVHGDLPGNVMFADGLPPAIIDWPVYWRPAVVGLGGRGRRRPLLVRRDAGPGRPMGASAGMGSDAGPCPDLPPHHGRRRRRA